MNRQQIEKDKKMGQLLKTLTKTPPKNNEPLDQTDKIMQVVKIQEPKLSWS